MSLLFKSIKLSLKYLSLLLLFISIVSSFSLIWLFEDFLVFELEFPEYDSIKDEITYKGIISFKSMTISSTN